MREVVNIRCAEIIRLSSGIMQMKYRPDIEIGLDDVKEVERTFIKLTNGGDIYTLLDSTGPYINISNDAQRFLGKDASIVTENKMKASAIVIDRLPNRLLIHFFIKFLKPRFMTKIFSTRESAIIWLESLKDDSGN